MNYCDTFHWGCLLDPFYLVGFIVWLWIECTLAAVAIVPFFYLFMAIFQGIHDERRGR